MKLIKSGPAFPLAISWGVEGRSWGVGGGIQTLVSPGFESANLKCSARRSFSFLHFLHIKLLSPLFQKRVGPQKTRINFSATEAFGIRAVFDSHTRRVICGVRCCCYYDYCYYCLCLVCTLSLYSAAQSVVSRVTSAGFPALFM